ncbi:sigma-Y antisigma factor component [Bacillus sp. 31A1R]|uniref:Sigma-Y antisigma factor component n=1 Tax=Robertmurraya mangrovi TaxID=3098077 RepID=A0ABU5ISR8_9BACI|nr:sigma-Y antisigma factor component [Bacillus sp. 31A1R]MDZ5470166.1 sigma-Y antisigma factor component [Bacillus sp. 31A1R]
MNEEVSLPLLIIVGIILLSQSLFLFIHARKHGHNFWLWGIIGLIQVPMPLLFYLLFVRKIWKKSNR